MKELRSIPEGSTLGLNYTCMHDSSIAILGPDGRPLFACALERISRTKQDGRWPDRLLSQVPWDRITNLAIGSLSLDESRQLGERRSRHDWPARRKQSPQGGSPFAYPDGWSDRIASLPMEPSRYDHHHCHAASAFFPSGFEDALVITMDAGAHQCPWHMAFYEASGGRVEIAGGMHFLEYIAPAHLYTMVTALLGLRPNRHEGKVTGLAARGDVDADQLARFEELAWPMTEQVGDLVTWDLCEDVGFAPTVGVNESVRRQWRAQYAEFSDAQLAACAQQVLESSVLALVDKAKEVTGNRHDSVCLAGGVFANVLLNQKVIDRFDRGFVAPAMTDDGVGIGAAYLAWFDAHPDAASTRHRATMYLGPDLEDVDQTLEENGITWEEPEQPGRRIAELLSDGCTVALARGRMEFGPRALGHRSVLAQATDPSINDWLNKLLQRTEYMPFAPIVRRDRASELFQSIVGVEETARFMTVTLDSSDEMSRASPAAVHVDRTARPQFVDADDDALVADILDHYLELTGLSSIVNTSFNVHEQPIICSTHDALLGFAQTHLDYLYLGQCLIRRDDNQDALERYIQASATADTAPANLDVPMVLGRWIDRTRHRAAATSEENQRLFEELQAIARDHQALVADHARVVDECARLQADCDRSTGDLEQENSEIARLRTELEALEKRHRSLLSSRWVRLGLATRLLDTWHASSMKTTNHPDVESR